MTVEQLGIDVGSTNIKISLLLNGVEQKNGILSHEGNVAQTIETLLAQIGINKNHVGKIKVLITGTEGRHSIKVNSVIAPLALERGLLELKIFPEAVVSMGGEDLVVYTLNKKGEITSTLSGNKCASGTGEFFRQQLGRMNMDLADLDRVVQGAHVHKISARCSVFMKSDCTHRLNKGESTVGDIALSLSKIMADKVSEFLTKARIKSGTIALIGGMTQNKHLLRFLKQTWPQIEFIVPAQSPYFEAFGAAHLADDQGSVLPPHEVMFNKSGALSYETLPPINDFKDRVKYIQSMQGEYDPNAEYILGVDGGSTTTKVTLVNIETSKIVAQHYGRTHGDPVSALKECIRQVKKQLNGPAPKITLAATTGSSRELLGVFLETPAVYNEILAHTVGTTFFDPKVDTIFEIGGQDAKYVYINNSVPIDYAMNEACSAGTGSFLEESAKGDLNIGEAKDIGPIALKAQAPLRFGEHCSAFINSDIRKAIQQNATIEDIVAGIVFSIVSNYLNRVVGNRRIGDHILLQGGVAKNPAVPLAFASLTGKKITVPPNPELMGCFGVAQIARDNYEAHVIEKGNFDLDTILEKEIKTVGTFTCKSCDNLCEIRRLEISGHKYPFGGRCSKFTNSRKHKSADKKESTDYTQLRTKMLFEEFAPDPNSLPAIGSDVTVGVPMAFSVHSLWPLYSWFFHSLGVRFVKSTSISAEGIAKLESSYCFPAEIAHGAIQDVIDKKTDFIFLPFFRNMPTMEKAPVHATLCPLTQGLPFFARQAFRLNDDSALRPLISFEDSWDSSREEFEKIAIRLGRTRKEGAAAYNKGIAEYKKFLTAYKKLGEKVLKKIKADPDTVYIALLGRPYNAFTRDANMGIPRKFISHNVTIVPFDMIYQPDDEIFPNMYWYYGQQNMKSVRQIARIKNLYPAWITNFSCAPDSFMLHYLRWMMGQKPYLVLEIDSHSADAGIDTRIEAFLDIVHSYRRSDIKDNIQTHKRRYETKLKKEFMDIVDNKTGERIDVRDPRVTLIWPSMGDLSTEATSTATLKTGIKSEYLPVPNRQTTQLARNVASGKECIPALLVLGSILQYLQNHPPNQPNEILLFFVPSTLGPCRTGQYYVFYERLFEDMGWENVLIMVADSSNSYREMGPTFNRDVWLALVLGDYFTDARIGLRLMAKDVDSALDTFSNVWKDIIQTIKAGKDIEQSIAKAAKKLSAIPRKKEIDELHKVLIVGEIYVRRDTFSVTEITDFLISKNIFPKVTGITEWINYTDHSRKHHINEQISRNSFLSSIRNGVFKEKAWFQVEYFYKEMVEHKVARHMKTTGLIPPVPHDMNKIVDNAERYFIDPNLESEATCSTGAAATGMEEGYNGVAIIAPFACLPGRLIEGIYSPWARRRGYPVITLENDGQPYPPNVLARMEIFAHNVARFKKKRDD